MITFTMADLFCGAGGTSTGALEAVRALGYRPALTAVNHWPVAVATHEKNHPEARHFCASLDALNPRELFKPGELKLLWASPECTNHSVARRGPDQRRPADPQRRSMTQPAHTPRFWTVTGLDFGRSIAWSRRWINPLSAAELRRRIAADLGIALPSPATSTPKNFGPNGKLTPRKPW